jgi:putative spermidine/putrescine transport system permease protein
LASKGINLLKSPFILIAPGLAVLIFFLVALFSLGRLSVYQYVPGGKLWVPTLTLDNYWTFLSQSVYRNDLWLTMRISAECTVIALFLSYPVAYVLARVKSVILSGIILTLIIISNFTSTVVILYVWLLALSDNGIVNGLLLALGLISQPLRLTYNEFAVVLAMVDWVLPFTIFSLVGAIQNIEPSLEQAAQSLGANKMQTFLKVTLPLSIPGIVAAVLLSFLGEITSFVIPMIMGGGRFDFISNLIYEKIIFSTNFPFGSAASMILLAVTMFIGYGINKTLMRKTLS